MPKYLVLSQKIHKIGSIGVVRQNWSLFRCLKRRTVVKPMDTEIFKIFSSINLAIFYKTFQNTEELGTTRFGYSTPAILHIQHSIKRKLGTTPIRYVKNTFIELSYEGKFGNTPIGYI